MTDEPRTSEKKEGRLGITNILAIVVLAICFAASSLHVFETDRETDADVVQLHVVHWQLEAGFREAFDVIARSFEGTYEAQTGRRVHIVQNALTERVYKQFVQTQGMGGTLPDLVQLGRDEEGSVPRFFLSNTQHVRQPNPYNVGTDLAGVPWMDTYLDGMIGSVDKSDLEYYGAPSSTLSMRLFYNKRILREGLGIDDPPTSYREFLTMCEELRRWAAATGRDGFVPIAASRYQVGVFQGAKAATLLRFMLRHDYDYDGVFGENDELLFAFAGGDFDYYDPAIRADALTMARITEHFPSGFMAMERMEAQFRFTQGQSAFCASGSWDANSFTSQVDFPMGIVDFPRPDRDDPEFGEYVVGRVSEANAVAVFRLGISRRSKHPDVALAFLQYLTSQKVNERFNLLCRWPPAIRGAKPHPLMEPFVRDPNGFWTGNVFRLIANGPANAIYEQARWELMEHKVDYDQFATMLERELPRALAQEFERLLDRDRQDRLTLNMGLSYQHVVDLLGSSQKEDGGSGRTHAKATFLWETRMQRFRNCHRLYRWYELVGRGEPKALEIQRHIRAELSEAG
jgi:raffinose/stachyose/melibiose transport system substrate-binding protein